MGLDGQDRRRTAASSSPANRFSSPGTCSGIRSKARRTSSTAPDALVVFGRPPGYRGSYKQWDEDEHCARRSCSRCCRRATPTRSWTKSSASTTVTGSRSTTSSTRTRNHDRRLSSVGRIGSSPVCGMDGYVSPRLKIRFEANERIDPVSHRTAAHSRPARSMLRRSQRNCRKLRPRSRNNGTGPSRSGIGRTQQKPSGTRKSRRRNNSRPSSANSASTRTRCCGRRGRRLIL